jgi:Glycosyl transferases group 1
VRFAIVTNNNGIGLELDARLLGEWLSRHGHEAFVFPYDQPLPVAQYDVAILLEVCVPEVVNLAPRMWYFVNQEWLKPEFIQFLKTKVERIFVKTKVAEEILHETFQKVSYVGFLTRDQYDPAVVRERSFLHIGGNGGYRNTQAVIEAWRSYRYWNGPGAADAELTVVSNSNEVSFEPTPGVTFIKRATDAEIRRLQNSHIYHLYPSATEGWGHALHEALSVGAVLLTTDAAPMNEFGAAFTVPARESRKKNFAYLYGVEAADIRGRVPGMMALRAEEIKVIGGRARYQFEKSNEEFGRLFSPFLEEPRRSVEATKPRLALIGNFNAPFSTENDLLWTLREMGYLVETFQENEARTEEIARTGATLVIYIHTHGWQTPGTMTMDQVLVGLRRRGVKTASFHLDRYWGLNKLDGREDKIGKHPFWHTDHVFTADGACHNWVGWEVNHHWLPPGVVKRDCYQGQRDEDIGVEIGFVGARDYHPEYPFRRELIEFLEAAYGDRFRAFSGYRGAALNNLYASIPVIVGDSCFGGSDYYWSDRIPETLGRSGFLIHPASKGLCIPGLVTFEAGDLQGLRERVDYYLVHVEEREWLRRAAFNWVRENETYHNRMEELLRKCL